MRVLNDDCQKRRIADHFILIRLTVSYLKEGTVVIFQPIDLDAFYMYHKAY